MNPKWKKANSKTMAKRVKKIESTLKVRKPEVKNVLHGAFNQSLSITGAVVIQSDIAEGITSLTRNGLDIQCLKFKMNYILNHDPGVNISRARILFVRDKQQIADTPPTVSDVLYNVALSPVTFYSELHKGRFDVLYDKTHTMDVYKRYASGKISVNLSKKGATHYNGSLASDTQKNQYYLMWISDQITYVPTMTYQTRLDYIDC